MHSLIMSRLLFHAHLMMPYPKQLKILNQTYMRVVRRIAGCSRFNAEAESDVNVRKTLGVPSVDCLIQQARLLYLRRILANKPTSLTLVLGIQHNGLRLPWVVLILNDMRTLQKVSTHLAELPDPADDAHAWSQLILAEEQKWRDAVAALRYCESACDRCKTTPANNEGGLQVCVTFSCDLCERSPEGEVRTFATARALKSHQRTLHGVRIPMRYYVEADGVCPSCGKDFHTRLRCMRHLSGALQGGCWQKILAARTPKLSEARVRVLDAEDCADRKRALRSGHTHPLAELPASRN
jgi:hypothetical protein